MSEPGVSRVRRLAAVVAGALLALLLVSPPASAHEGDPGRWILANEAHVPLEYFQGITIDPRGELFFDGIFTGLYGAEPVAAATGSGWATEETARSADIIPAEVRLEDGYNHIGDLTWAPDEQGARGGRLLLPLECFYPGEEEISKDRSSGNVCVRDANRDGVPEEESPGTGAIGVAVEDRLRLVKGIGDKLVHTFEWRYHVPLAKTFPDAPAGAGMTKAMWAELSPNGRLLWTQASSTTDGSGEPHLLAYDARAFTAANAEQGTKPLLPELILPGVLALGDEDALIEQVTGATFVGDRLYVAGQRSGETAALPVLDDDVFEVWSFDVERCKLMTRCDARLELHRHIVGESEGLATGCVLGGLLHWQIAPNNRSTIPTYWLKGGVGQTTLLSFVPSATTVGVASCS